MSSQGHPLTLSQIETSPPSPSPGKRTPSPDPLSAPFGSTGSHTHSPARSASPSQSNRSAPSNQSARSNRSAPSRARLPRTPPAQQLFQSSGADTQRMCYFGPGITASRTGKTSPSENLSASSCLSPQPSSGGSMHSSDQWSQGSGELLTPPQIQVDTDNPPYRARTRRSDSLTMGPYLRRASTEPNSEQKDKKRNHRRHSCRYRRIRPRDHQPNTHWWLPACQVSPTAPQGLKELCQGRAGNYVPTRTSRGITDTFGRLLSRKKSRPASPLLTRRWSSVEIGAHQINLKPTLPSASAKSKSATPTIRDSRVPSPSSNSRFRSSTFTRGAIDHDIVRTVRETLTLRKVPRYQMETPASITLRRASGASNMSDVSTIIGPLSPRMTGISGGTTPKARHEFDVKSRRESAEYLITSQDIDTITELIEANLKRRHMERRRADQRGMNSSPVDFRTVSRVNSPTVTRHGLVPSVSPPTTPSVSTVKATRLSMTPKTPFDYLQVIPASQRKNPTLARSSSHKSSHEVIWQGGEFPQSASSQTDEDTDKLNLNSSAPATPAESLPEFFIQSKSPKRDKGDAFDPKNAKASINEWQWRSRVNDVPVIVTSSDSESNDTPQSIPAIKRPKFITSRMSEPNKEASQKQPPLPRPKFASQNSAKPGNVVSFPPLPARQTTNDWYSPLPEIDIDPNAQYSRSLYDLGLDMTCAPSPSTTRPATPKAARTSWLPSGKASLNQSGDLNPEYDFQDKKTLKPESRTSSFEGGPESGGRRKSSVKIHPKAVPRVGESFTMGHSIGASSGERRRSSANVLQRVRTIDNIHKGEGTSTWGRWRPPSICPTPKQPSPSELEAEREEWITANRARQQSPTDMLRSTHSERMNMLKGKGPPLPEVDCVGIYGQFTGHGNKKRSLSPCVEECKRHTCEDCERDPRSPNVDWIG